MARRIAAITQTNQIPSTGYVLAVDSNGYGVWQDLSAVLRSAGLTTPFDIQAAGTQLLSTTQGIYSHPNFTGNTTINGSLTVQAPESPTWVAVGSSPGGANIATSINQGQSWTRIPAFSNGQGKAVSYSPQQGLWVAVGTSDTSASTIVWSNDGATWCPSTSGPFEATAEPHFVEYFPSSELWVATAVNSSTPIKYSTDGKIWLDATVPAPSITSVAFNGCYYLATGGRTVSTDASQIFYAVHPQGPWTAVARPFSADTLALAIAASPSAWIAAGIDTTNNGSSLMVSTDGQSWTPVANAFPTVATSITYNRPYWVATGYDYTNSGNTIRVSSDGGRTWVVANGAFSSIAYHVSYTGSLWIATGLSTTGSITTLVSSDAFTWVAAGGAAGGAVDANPLSDTIAVSSTPMHPPILTVLQAPPRVGINTANPEATLDVAGDMYVSGSIQIQERKGTLTNQNPAPTTLIVPSATVSVDDDRDYRTLNDASAVQIPSQARVFRVNYADPIRRYVLLPDISGTSQTPQQVIVHNATGQPLTVIDPYLQANLLSTNLYTTSSILPPNQASSWIPSWNFNTNVPQPSPPYMYYEAPFIGPAFPSLDNLVTSAQLSTMSTATGSLAASTAALSTYVAVSVPTYADISTLSAAIGRVDLSNAALSTYVQTQTATKAELSTLSSSVLTLYADISAVASSLTVFQQGATGNDLSTLSSALSTVSYSLTDLSHYVYASTATIQQMAALSSSISTFGGQIADISTYTQTQTATTTDVSALSASIIALNGNLSSLSSAFKTYVETNVSAADISNISTQIGYTNEALSTLSTTSQINYNSLSSYYTALGADLSTLSTQVAVLGPGSTINIYNNYYSTNYSTLSTYIEILTISYEQLSTYVGVSTATKSDISTLSASIGSYNLAAASLSSYIGVSAATYKDISTLSTYVRQTRNQYADLSTYVGASVPTAQTLSSFSTTLGNNTSTLGSLSNYVIASTATKTELSSLKDELVALTDQLSNASIYVYASTPTLAQFTTLSTSVQNFIATAVTPMNLSTLSTTLGQYNVSTQSTLTVLAVDVSQLSTYVATGTVSQVEYDALVVNMNTLAESTLTLYAYVQASTATYKDISTLSASIGHLNQRVVVLSTYVQNSTTTLAQFSTFESTITGQLDSSIRGIQEHPIFEGELALKSIYTYAVKAAEDPVDSGPLYIVGDPQGGINVIADMTSFSSLTGQGLGQVYGNFYGTLNNVGGTFNGTLDNVGGTFRGTVNSLESIDLTSGNLRVQQGAVTLDNGNIYASRGNVYANNFFGNFQGTVQATATGPVDTAYDIRTTQNLYVGGNTYIGGYLSTHTAVVSSIGVGIQNPQYPLDIAGSLRVQDLVQQMKTISPTPADTWVPALFEIPAADGYFEIEIVQPNNKALQPYNNPSQVANTAAYLKISGYGGVPINGAYSATNVDIEFSQGSYTSGIPSYTKIFYDISFDAVSNDTYSYLTVFLNSGPSGDGTYRPSFARSQYTYYYRIKSGATLKAFAPTVSYNTRTGIATATSIPYTQIPVDIFRVMTNGKVRGYKSFSNPTLSNAFAITTPSIDYGFANSNTTTVGVNRPYAVGFNLDVSGSARITGSLSTNTLVSNTLYTSTITATTAAMNSLNVLNKIGVGMNSLPNYALSISGNLYVGGTIINTNNTASREAILYSLNSTKQEYHPPAVLEWPTRFKFVKIFYMGGGGGGAAGVRVNSTASGSSDVFTVGGGGGGSGQVKVQTFVRPDAINKYFFQFVLGYGGRGGQAVNLKNNSISESYLLNTTEITFQNMMDAIGGGGGFTVLQCSDNSGTLKTLDGYPETGVSRIYAYGGNGGGLPYVASNYYSQSLSNVDTQAPTFNRTTTTSGCDCSTAANPSAPSVSGMGGNPTDATKIFPGCITWGGNGGGVKQNGYIGGTDVYYDNSGFSYGGGVGGSIGNTDYTTQQVNFGPATIIDLNVALPKSGVGYSNTGLLFDYMGGVYNIASSNYHVTDTGDAATERQQLRRSGATIKAGGANGGGVGLYDPRNYAFGTNSNLITTGNTNLAGSGGGGGPLGGYAAWANSSSDLRAAANGEFGCGGGGGRPYYMNAGVWTTSGGGRGGNGWVSFEFYNTAATIDYININAQGNAYDITPVKTNQSVYNTASTITF